MEDFCTQKSSYFYHKILSKTQKLCTFLTSADFKAFLYVNPLINFNNSKTNQQICILATFFVLQPFWYILCCVLQSPLFKGFKLAQTTERRPNLVNLPVYQSLQNVKTILYFYSTDAHLRLLIISFSASFAISQFAKYKTILHLLNRHTLDFALP